jgi:hypothetical protein
MAEISAVLERLSSSAHFSRGRHRLLPLHSAISSQQQRAAFEVRAAGAAAGAPASVSLGAMYACGVLFASCLPRPCPPTSLTVHPPRLPNLPANRPAGAAPWGPQDRAVNKHRGDECHRGGRGLCDRQRPAARAAVRGLTWARFYGTQRPALQAWVTGRESTPRAEARLAVTRFRRAARAFSNPALAPPYCCCS